MRCHWCSCNSCIRCVASVNVLGSYRNSFDKVPLVLSPLTPVQSESPALQLTGYIKFSKTTRLTFRSPKRYFFLLKGMFTLLYLHTRLALMGSNSCTVYMYPIHTLPSHSYIHTTHTPTHIYHASCTHTHLHSHLHLHTPPHPLPTHTHTTPHTHARTHAHTHTLLYTLPTCIHTGTTLSYYKGEDEYSTGEPAMQKFNLTGKTAHEATQLHRHWFFSAYTMTLFMS